MRDPEVSTAVHQAERGDVKVEPMRQTQRADHRDLQHDDASPLVLGSEKGHVKPRVVRDKHAAAKQLGKPPRNVGERGLVG
jgi:hypothetical protein